MSIVSNKTSRQRLSDHFKRLYKDAGLTQQQVAERLGMTQACVSDLATGKTPWGIDRLVCVSKVFGIHVADFVRVALQE